MPVFSCNPRSVRALLCPSIATFLLLVLAGGLSASTVALWLFDEQAGLYPSCVLGDAATNKFPLVLGRGGQIVSGRFGNALEPLEQAEIDLSLKNRYVGFERVPRVDPSRKMPPMDWSNAKFCALMTRGEKHLRREVGFASPTSTKLNLADFDWTVEFWYQPTRKSDDDCVVFEIGQGPRGENNHVTQLLLNVDRKSFTLINEPSGTRLTIPSDARSLSGQPGEWHHFAFVYDAHSSLLRHYVDGKPQPPPTKCSLKPLARGDEDYMSIGRDGMWQRPLPGRLDEMRISDEQVYRSDFRPPGSFSKYNETSYQPPKLKPGLPLLFAGKAKTTDVVQLRNRKYVFIDDALVATSSNLTFNVNPPRPAERVLPGIAVHLSVWQDDAGLIRMYYAPNGKPLHVLTSHDGVHWEKPTITNTSESASNMVIADPVGTGTIFVDPNAPREERIKYLSGYDGRAIYMYSSPDGYHFKRSETAALPFRAASQSIAYYDDQRQKYVAFHRTDMPRTVGGHTERSYVMTETTDPVRPWPFRPISLAEQLEISKHRRIGKTLPWYLDNGPLTPPGFGVEYPVVFGPDDKIDPIATDMYVPKAMKYPWAPDTYVAFPIMYFHYHDDGPDTRQELGRRERGRGSGTLEDQVAVSRDGIHWKRYPRPAYIKLGKHDGLDIHKAYIAQGMVQRGDEIWQYYYGSEQYHSNWGKQGRDAIFRVVQRLDGFISADTPYSGGEFVTRPLTFEGNRLRLNIDTGAAGFAQVGIEDDNGHAFDGFGVDDCLYINGDFVATEVEWLKKGKDVKSLTGTPVRIRIRSRGTKLYALQFADK